MVKFDNSVIVDEIVREGTLLYQTVTGSHLSTNYLMISELPDLLNVRNASFKLHKHDPSTGLLGADKSDLCSQSLSLRDAIVPSFSTTRWCLLSIGNSNGAFTIAVCKSKTETEDKYVCFDSHSRSPSGLSASNGTAIVLEVESTKGLIVYINELAVSLFGRDYISMPFELCPVTIHPIDVCIADSKFTAELKSGAHKESDDTSQFSQSENLQCGSREDMDHVVIPNVCTRSQFEDWKLKRPWVAAKKLTGVSDLTGLTCKTCTDVGTLKKCVFMAKDRLKTSEEWITGVTAKSSKKLHDKMCSHEKSLAHKLCEKHLQHSCVDKLKNQWKNHVTFGSNKMSSKHYKLVGFFAHHILSRGRTLHSKSTRYCMGYSRKMGVKWEKYLFQTTAVAT